MGRIFNALALAFILLLPASQAQAQGAPQGAAQARSIDVAAKKPFKHRHSKVALPPSLAGLPRGHILELEGDQLDVSISYGTPDLHEVYTVYVYRNVSGGLPVWFDRARAMIEQRGQLGTATFREAPVAFVPPGRGNASGLAAVYALAGKDYRSTGIALVPVGEWLVKMRASSTTLSPDELDARMKAALAEIAWPGNMAAAPAAVPVTACKTALAYAGDAKPFKSEDDSGGAMLLGALLGQAVATDLAQNQAAAAVQTHWCRDPAALEGAGIYRADEETDGYLLALADAGRAAEVGRSAGQALMEIADEKPGKPAYAIELLLLGETLTSTSFDALPPPSQALAIVKEGRFSSSVPTWGKKKGEIRINADALK
jgi:hypothetical protein